MFKTKNNSDFFFQRALIFTVIISFATSFLNAQGVPQIISNKKTATQNYLPDYSYAGYHSGEVEIGAKATQISNATDNGVVANDAVEDSKNLIKAIKAASAIKGDDVYEWWAFCQTNRCSR